LPHLPFTHTHAFVSDTFCGKKIKIVNEENYSKIKHKGNSQAHSLSLNHESLSQGHSATRVNLRMRVRSKKHLNDVSDFAGTYVSLKKLHV
jgi:hypothetical protein